VVLHRHSAILSLLLTTCGAPFDDEGGSISSTESDSTTTMTTEAGFVAANDHQVPPSCNEYTQDCPDGEKCVPYASSGNNWDAFKCVAIMGDQATGEPCTYGGIVEASDDCDEISGCWNVQDLEGEALGTCHAFCTGTADNPECPEGTSCTLSGSGVPAYCIPICDPVAQDCDPGLGCYYGGGGFQCLISPQNIPAGEPCGFTNDCAPGLMCLDGELLPACNGSACCGRFCNLDLGDAQCEATPGTACEPYFENGTAPLGLEHVGVCIVPGA
jgi:hypothetical protein